MPADSLPKRTDRDNRLRVQIQSKSSETPGSCRKVLCDKDRILYYFG